MANQLDLNSDGEDEDEFVPSKTAPESSEEDAEGEGLESDEEVVSKRGRRAVAIRSSTRTPRKTPSRKVKELRSF